MSVKKLEPVQALPTDHPLPPRPLGKDGMATWMRIQTEYGVTDSGGIELLFQACAACDRVQSLSEQIAQDGEVIRTKHGVRAHLRYGTSWPIEASFAAHCIGLGSMWKR
jgi:hypothetical protein